ncbi:hypothetical protein ACWEN3_36560, partial [Streptomyces sp. NPDC004561]
MVSMNHTVVVRPVPYARLVDALAVVRTLVEESRVEGPRLVLPDGQPIPGVRLARGRHLRPGAEYLLSDEEDEHGDGHKDAKGEGAGETVSIRVEEWDRRRAVRLALAVASGDGNTELHTVLKSLDHPSLVEVGGRSLLDGVPPRFSQLEGRARVRLDD